ncbi:MAG: MlaD family protein [Planctomycetaceae bacterium]
MTFHRDSELRLTDSNAPGGTLSSKISGVEKPGDQQPLTPHVSHQPGDKFPMADVREVRAVTSALFLRSKLWWVTVACFFLAFWLTWSSIPSVGPTITIRFPDGHGLKAGDAVRHRGIEAGIVESVALSHDLSQITATVTLTPGAAGLAREGARFWIVRPQLSLAGVSGLETAVGAKYIGVSPGNPDAPQQSNFEGLGAAPPDENSGEGIDIVLRSDAKHGVTVGAPVTWRGVDVGQILSINLSPDARFVDVHARINSEYTRLLRTSSKFWVTSGLGIDVGLSGVRLNADSLSTIVRGGVSFTTLAVSKEKTPITSGHMFQLYDEPDAAWLNTASSLPLVDFDLPPTLTIQGTRRTSLLGIARLQKFTVNGVLVRRGDQTFILTAADALPEVVADSKDAAEKGGLEYVISSPQSTNNQTLILPPSAAGEATENSEVSGSVFLPFSDSLGDLPLVDYSNFRSPKETEECCLCRSVKTDDDASTVIQSIGLDHLKQDGSNWLVNMEDEDLSPWHGAPVISMQDGRIIGLFVAGKKGAMIVPNRETP